MSVVLNLSEDEAEDVLNVIVGESEHRGTDDYYSDEDEERLNHVARKLSRALGGVDE